MAGGATACEELDVTGCHGVSQGGMQRALYHPNTCSHYVTFIMVYHGIIQPLHLDWATSHIFG